MLARAQKPPIYLIAGRIVVGDRAGDHGDWNTMAVCDACHQDLGNVFLVEDGAKLCARCLELKKPDEDDSRMMLVLDAEDELAS